MLVIIIIFINITNIINNKIYASFLNTATEPDAQKYEF